MTSAAISSVSDETLIETIKLMGFKNVGTEVREEYEKTITQCCNSFLF
ncbi:hypothetical protein UT300007_08660 [Clostridium sp. CTA-7]